MYIMWCIDIIVCNVTPYGEYTVWCSGVLIRERGVHVKDWRFINVRPILFVFVLLIIIWVWYHGEENVLLGVVDFVADVWEWNGC